MPLFPAALTIGLLAYQIQKLQRAQNSVARLVFEESKICHITPLLRTLHWLPVAYRIVFKILVLTLRPFINLQLLRLTCCDSRSQQSYFLRSYYVDHQLWLHAILQTSR